MNVQLLKQFWTESRKNGIRHAFDSTKTYFSRSKHRIKLEQWWRYNRHYVAEIDPYRILWIDPVEINDRNKTVIEQSERYISHVIGGDWDQDRQKFEERVLYQSLKNHFKEDVPWKDTQKYQQTLQEIENGNRSWAASSKAELKERCSHLDQLYSSIRHNGFQTHDEMLDYSPMYPREIKVQIGRGGDFFYLNGKHRLSIAKILEVDQVPVQVIVRHEEWQAIRDEVALSNETTNPSLDAKGHTGHPDVSYLKVSEANI